MKYLSDKISKEYLVWLRSPNNPNFNGQKYENYDYYLDRLIVRSVELNLIDETKILITDLNWLKWFLKLYESSKLLQNADVSIANGGGRASLKRFIDFIIFKEKQRGNSGISSKDRETLFVVYLKECARQKGKKEGTFVGYKSALMRWWDRDAKSFSDKATVFDYDNATEFKSFSDQFWKGGDSDSKQGIELYIDFLSGKKEFQRGAEVKMNNAKEKELNLILYGPPGTGKTYNTVIRAVEIIDGKQGVQGKEYKEILNRYRYLTEEGRIAFTTFHQSYGYEEFIEGIKPVSNKGEVKYEVCPGVFKEFCDTAKTHLAVEKNGSGALEDGLDLIKTNATVWKISLDSAGHKGFEFHNKCLEEDCIRVGWDENEDLSLVTEDGKDSAERFINEMKIGDVVLSCYSQNAIDAIGVITGEYEWHDDEPRLKRFRKVKWLKKWTGETKYNILSDNLDTQLTQTTVYKLWRITIDKIKKILSSELREEPQDVVNDKQTEDKYVFIIDEINRGNVSKIFGELITLIEPDKRLGAEEAMKCILPYSKDKFGVPKNVYIIGTMNTADRSLVQLDAALRRRFDFEEMMPDPEGKLLNFAVEDIHIGKMLKSINDKIAALLDREHQIGHSYFINVKNVRELAHVFKQKIIPLLQEYFFDDYTLIREVLSERFVIGNPVTVLGEERTVYTLKAPEEKQAYVDLYGKGKDEKQTDGI